MMKVTMFALPLMATACDLTYDNKMSQDITLCVRQNGGVPGAAGKITVKANSKKVVPCHNNTATTSVETYFPLLGFDECGYDTCAPPLINTGTCIHYPYVLGQGVSAANSNWYGSIGYNWDGAGQGCVNCTYDYSLELTCTAYKTQKIDDNCGPSGCTPNKPNYAKPNSGVEECDSDSAITVTITSPSAGCDDKSYCCPDAKHCLAPGKPTPCGANSTCAGGKTCCPLTKLCVTVEDPCTPVCDAKSYCCPDAKHCLTPVNPGVLCANDTSCASGDVCCPLIKECVSVGDACNP